MMKNNMKNDNIGSIGIGAMIVFIALILVAAVASAVIIQTGEKLQQNAQQTGSDTQREIAGKINIKKVIINDADDVFMYFESSPGSDVLDVTDIAYQAACTNDNGGATGYQFLAGVFGDGSILEDENIYYAYGEDTMGSTDEGGDGDFGDTVDDSGGVDPTDGDDTDREALLINPGENYVILMDFEQGNGADCGTGDLSINDEITLWIHVEGGGSTYETLTITDKTIGSDLV
tara:strand:- start:777 stop:1472 length:696 start_codon:yes stop_codon:yes gene_type:complete